MATEVVTVTGERAQLETETSELGQVVDSRRINALPLNGRNYAQLALLGAGVAAAEPGSRVETTYGFSANGARSLQNNFLLDGIDNNANLGDVLNGAAYVVQPAVDAIAEFKVETNAYSAEFGRGNGAIMNAVIKSGTNQIPRRSVGVSAQRQIGYAATPSNDSASSLTSRTSSALRWAAPSSRTKCSFSGTTKACAFARRCRSCPRFPLPAEVGGDFSAFLDSSRAIRPIPGVLDCSGNPTYQGEIFDPGQAQTNCGVQSADLAASPSADRPQRIPTNIFTDTSPRNLHRSAGRELANLFPRRRPISLLPGGNYLGRSGTQRNREQVRHSHRLDDQRKDNFFARYSYGNDSNFLPSPFNNVLDGGSFQDGYSQNTRPGPGGQRGPHLRQQSDQRISLWLQHLNSHRYNLYYNDNVSQRHWRFLSRSSFRGRARTSAACLRSLSGWHQRHWRLGHFCPLSKSSTAMFSATT